MKKKPRREPLTVMFNIRLPRHVRDQLREFVLEELDEYGQRRYRTQSHFVEESIVKNLPRNRVTHRSTG